MHEYTCAVVSVLILCFFLVLRIFWEEQLAEQFWYFNFSLYLVVFWAEQSKKAPCMNQLLPTFAIRKKIWLTRQKVFPPPTVGVPSASKSPSALSARA